MARLGYTRTKVFVQGFYNPWSAQNLVLVPIRCFTCGNVIADKYEAFQDALKEKANPSETLDSLGLKRYCCRRMLLTTVETIQQIIPFQEAVHKRNLEVKSELE